VSQGLPSQTSQRPTPKAELAKLNKIKETKNIAKNFFIMLFYFTKINPQW